MSSIFSGALIGDEHTLHDWGAVITNSDVIGMPEPNTVLLEVPGRSGRLDLSEVLTGDVTYSNREIKLELAAQTNKNGWVEICFHIFNKFHGRVVQIVFDEDPGHYYVGRLSISDPKRLAGAGTLVITVDAEPYRYETELTTTVISGSGSVVSGMVENLRMPAVPKITAPAACQLFIGGKSYDIAQADEQTVPGLVFSPFENEVSVTGSSSITFIFRRGCL